MPPHRLIQRRPATSKWVLRALLLAVALLLSACGSRDKNSDRTPVPTWTPTPLGALAVAPPAMATSGAAAPIDVPPQSPAEPLAVPVESAPPTAVVVIADTPTAAPPTVSGLITATPIPTATPTPVATATPAPPTNTPTPQPTPTPDFPFILEEATRFPTTSLAPDVVRIWLYVYSPAELALGGYSLSVRHNGNELTVDEISLAGIPDQTRPEPGPLTRFTNLNVLYIESQAGIWEIQLIDATGAPAGPAAVFQLGPDQLERELYVRYKQVRPQ